MFLPSKRFVSGSDTLRRTRCFCSKSTAGIIHVIGFTFNLFRLHPDGWDSFKGNIAVVSKKNAAAFLGKPKEAVTEEEVLKRLAKEAEIIEQAINGDLFEVCGPQSDDFCRHGWFLDEEDAAKFAEEEYPDFKYKDEDFRTIYELKTA